jgi:glutamyl-tRNA synthetase
VHVPSVITRRGRFAPSPTGELHLGGARTALAAWLQARAAGGAFVLRVEDLDRQRRVAGAEQRILDDLRWLGLDWDEGPDVGGPAAPYRQSERTALYEAALAGLDVYPCFCSRAEVARVAAAPHGPGDDGPRYPGTCRDLTSTQIAERARTRAPSVRLRVAEGEITFVDRVHGERREDVAATVGDFVLRRADGVFAYQLAVVVDDGAMAVTDVVRGDDLVGSTVRQLYLFRALGLGEPAFAHVPLVLGPDGARLSKRHGAIAVRDLAERGATPARVVGLLAAGLGLVGAGEQATARELVAGFDLGRIARAPTVIDPNGLTIVGNG